MANGNQKAPRAKAEHSLLGPNGDVVEEMEEAIGCRYVILGSRQTIDYYPGGQAIKPGSPLIMLANFGTKTLMTNEASQARQAGDDEELGIRNRFTLLDTGVWVDRSRDGVAVIDRDSMAVAAVDEMIAQGEADSADKDSVVAKMRVMLDDPATLKFVRQTANVQARYDALVGKQKKTAADLAELVRKA